MLNASCLDKNSAFLIEDYTDRKYFSGVDLAEGFVFLYKTPVYFTDARYFYAAKNKIAAADFLLVLYTGLESIKSIADSFGITRLGVDYNKTSVAFYNRLKDLGFELFDCSESVAESRSVKTETEIGYIKKACEIAQTAFYNALKTVKVGMTETELKNVIEKACFSLGAEKMSFDTIVAFGENSAVPHHETDQTVLQPDSPVLVDMGCVYKGYCSDLTRTVFFGKPPKKFIMAYQAVLRANEETEAEFKAGDKISLLHNNAVRILQEYGFDKYFTHSLGHGVGLEIHESPAVNGKNDSVLKAGTVFTVEPGVYFDGEFGIRIEDTVIATEKGIKRFFTDGKELVIIKQ